MRLYAITVHTTELNTNTTSCEPSEFVNVLHITIYFTYYI